MEQADFNTFDGGFTFEEHPGAYQRGMWSRLDGFVVDDRNRLRTQPPIARLEVGSSVEVVASFVEASRVYHIDSSGSLQTAAIDPAAVTGAGNVGANLALDDADWADVPEKDRSSGSESSASSTIAAPTTSPYVIGRVRFAAEGTYYSGQAEGGTVVATSTASTVHLVYDGGQSELVTGIPASTATDEVPDGRAVGMWGDFTVWGNVRWYADADAGTGDQRYPNALWFSQPAKFNQYDPLDLIFLPAGDGRAPKVMDMVEVPAGLIVFCDTAVFLLRGSAADFEIERISNSGLGTTGGADFYGTFGAAVWCDDTGRVWLTDGNTVQRLDDGLGLPDEGVQDSGDTTDAEGPYCRVVGDKLLVARSPGHRLLVFQPVAGQKGVWTQMVLPEFGGNTGAYVLESLSVSQADGGLLLLHRAPTSGVSNRLVWLDVAGRTAGLKRGSYYSSYSGDTSGTVELTLGTPILESAPHKRTWWRRVGVTLGRTQDTDATLVSVTQWTSGGRTDGRGDGTFSDETTPGALAFLSSLFSEVVHRKQVVVPGIGPATFYRADFVFTGDVTIASVTVWIDGALEGWGRDESQAGSAGVA